MANRRQNRDKPLRVEESISMIAQELPNFTDAIRDLVDEIRSLRELAEHETKGGEKNDGEG